VQFVEQSAQLNAFLAAGLRTTATVGTALDNNIERLIGITTNLEPVLGVLADNSGDFLPIATRLRSVSDKFMTEYWDPARNVGTIMTIVSFTPHRLYSRSDCPRYGELAGPSCANAPVTPQAPIPPLTATPASFGGNVGSVGSSAEAEQLRRIVGGNVTAATTLLLGPLARNTVVNLQDGTR